MEKHSKILCISFNKIPVIYYVLDNFVYLFANNVT